MREAVRGLLEKPIWPPPPVGVTCAVLFIVVRGALDQELGCGTASNPSFSIIWLCIQELFTVGLSSFPVYLLKTSVGFWCHLAHEFITCCVGSRRLFSFVPSFSWPHGQFNIVTFLCPFPYLKIESEEYEEALSLAHTYALDTDLVYQRQWRKSAVNIASIQNYLVCINVFATWQNSWTVFSL